ncbi:MAG: flavodoxin-dependent (E)-4-hydroxy-3-methylbut-2-enyl-diphosphate synthase [Candidatus Peregrinibacteria bacterium]
MRIKTPQVKIGSIKIGGNNPVAIQSMTNTDTADALATALQCMELADAGSEIIRISVNGESAAAAVPEIRKILDARGYKSLPLIGDFHFNGHELLAAFPLCAKTLDKYRINPGNVDYGTAGTKNFQKIIRLAIKYKKPVRIGINRGSIPGSKSLTSLAALALSSAKLAEKTGLPQNRIVLSIKTSDLQDLIAVHEILVKKMKKQRHFYALHIGLTEAGSSMQGIVSSTAALAIILQKGIGDTIRISLTPAPGQPRTREVEACKTLLQSLNLRNFSPKIISCPGCGRTDNAFFQKLAQEINSHINIHLSVWLKKYPKIAQLKIAVMGCVVNGPGESRHADISISLPGKNESHLATVFIKGKFLKNLAGNNIPKEFIKILENYIMKTAHKISK